ncbi:hypothetical protein EDC96DRAFT_541972 [Choanephora cucurbitarum]|nr:hypothetical protein EDC96DRAFT_541972 [Choanephora cucurbitarum]
MGGEGDGRVFDSNGVCGLVNEAFDKQHCTWKQAKVNIITGQDQVCTLGICHLLLTCCKLGGWQRQRQQGCQEPSLPSYARLHLSLMIQDDLVPLFLTLTTDTLNCSKSEAKHNTKSSLIKHKTGLVVIVEQSRYPNCLI